MKPDRHATLHDPSEVEQITDGRLRRGARSRLVIARCAADVASEENLTGLSIGRIARDLGLSKGTVQTLFPTKEELQLAAVESAGITFARTVITPTLRSTAGRPRLRALINRWLDYARAPLFPGGCFWTASLADFAGRPGPVRDALLLQKRAWLDLLAAQVREMGTGLDADLTAFQLDAVLVATDIRLRAGDPSAVATARRAVLAIIDQDRAGRRTR